MAITKDEIEMLDDCELNSDKLTDWEARFIDDLSNTVELNQRQHDKLQEIWDKVC